MAELLDFDTLIAVKKAAPKVTPVPFDLACWIVRGMALFGAENAAHVDQNGQMYWQASIKDLTEKITQVEGITWSQVGRALKAMGIETWRKMDGSYAAWSAAQLEILKKYFKA